MKKIQLRKIHRVVNHLRILVIPPTWKAVNPSRSRSRRSRRIGRRIRRSRRVIKYRKEDEIQKNTYINDQFITLACN